jgi:hypothetical protein
VKVHESIAILQSFDGEASVYVMSQPHYPFEYDVAGVAVREDIADEDEDEGGVPASDLPGSDVFILEGSQLRYGDKGAWQAARRR